MFHLATMPHIDLQMKFKDIVRNRFIIPFQVSVNWIGGGEQIEKLEHELVLLGAKRHKIMMCSPQKCIGKANVHWKETEMC